MRGLLIALLSGLLSWSAAAQAPFIRTVADSALGATVRIVPTPDNGWALFSGDSLKLIKFNSCGRVEWTRRYALPGLTCLPGLHDVIALSGGGFAFMTRAQEGAVISTLVVRLDDAGVVQWARLLTESAYEPYPYTLGQDPQGNLVLYGNVSAGPANSSFNHLSKLSPAGALIWSRRYDLGAIWGGALLTSDNGVLARTGSRFIKTDVTGAVQWTSYVTNQSDYTYFAPVEVHDGYIFTSYNIGSQQISFYKIDKQGQLLWGGRKMTDLLGQSPYLRQRPNGNLVAIFNQADGGGTRYPTLVEFDADLRVVRRRSLHAGFPGSSLPQTGLPGSDLALTTDGTPVVVGRADAATPGFHFVARADTSFHVDCDTLLAPPTITVTPVTQGFLTTNALPFTPTLTARAATVTSFGVVQTTICAAPVELDLGPDTALCAATPLRLQNHRAGAFEQYEWSTGATTAAITVSQPGTYRLRVLTNCGLDTLTDSLTVTRTEVSAPTRARDTVRCSDDPVLLDARVPGPATYRWPDGSTNPRYYAADTGRYAVDITVAGCTRRVEFHVTECERLVMPNVFTPNADALNDRFVPIELRGIASATLEIYSRWGHRLFTTPDLRRGWDGTAATRGCPDGTYFYLVRYVTARGQAGQVKGWVELVEK